QEIVSLDSDSAFHTRQWVFGSAIQPRGSVCAATGKANKTSVANAGRASMELFSSGLDASTSIRHNGVHLLQPLPLTTLEPLQHSHAAGRSVSEDNRRRPAQRGSRSIAAPALRLRSPS